MVHFETERLLIRDHIEGDEEGLQRLLMDAKAMRYLPGLFCHTLEEVRAKQRTLQGERDERRKAVVRALEGLAPPAPTDE